MENRLTQRDRDGNWCLKGLKWEKIYPELQMITHEDYGILFGALCKLKDYEDTGLSPDGVEAMQDKTRWIPVEQWLPDPDLMQDAEVTDIKGDRLIAWYAGKGTWRKTENGDVVDVLAWKEPSEPYKPKQN